jgi:hypothetical protein
MGDLKETATYYVVGDGFITLESGEQKWINKIKRMKEKYPDEVTITAENDGKHVMARFPYPLYGFSFNRKRETSHEQRMAAYHRLINTRKRLLDEKNKQEG